MIHLRRTALRNITPHLEVAFEVTVLTHNLGSSWLMQCFLLRQLPLGMVFRLPGICYTHWLQCSHVHACICTLGVHGLWFNVELIEQCVMFLSSGEAPDVQPLVTSRSLKA